MWVCNRASSLIKLVNRASSLIKRVELYIVHVLLI